jgi:uncharacterized protein YndB with AHSA1/START domain
MGHVMGQVGQSATLATDERAPGVATTVTIPATPADLFALVTNASQWPRWHPATASVSDTPDRPLLHGESVVESIRAAGRSFTTRWVVVECDAPRRWVIATDSPQGCAWIEYTLNPEHAGTRFTRRLRWRSHSAFWGWCDRWLTRWILARQSRQALMNLASLFHTEDATP